MQIEGEVAVGNRAYEGRSEIFVRKGFTLWRKTERHAQCPKLTSFQIPFSAVETRRVGEDPLPPSYTCEVGQGGRIACSYSMIITVTQKSKHAFWHHRNRSVRYLFHLVVFFPPLVPRFRSPKAPWLLGPSIFLSSLEKGLTAPSDLRICFFGRVVPRALLFWDEPVTSFRLTTFRGLDRHTSSRENWDSPCRQLRLCLRPGAKL